VTVQKPTIGRIVIYKNFEGVEYPAMITMTTETWKDTAHPRKPPVLDGEESVHLLVFTVYGGEAHYNVERGTESRQWRWPVIA
jgi:hypothetical protein